MDGAVVSSKKEREQFSCIASSSSYEIVGYWGHLMCGEEGSGAEQLCELK